MKHGSMIMFRIVSTIVALAMVLGCSEHSDPDLGAGYRLDSYGEYSSAIVDSQNTEIVETHILNYTFDSTYIIASQKPWEVPNIPGLRDMKHSQRHKTFEESTFRQYWIINKNQKAERSLDTVSMRVRRSNVYGPFDRQEYLRKRVELGVPKELILKEQER